MELKSPAKLNLFLHITGRRQDGYHELQTVFQLIDLCDTLSFSRPDLAPPGSLSLRCDTPGIPLENNLIIDAANHLKQAANCQYASADISLVKRIPMGAGLGGGSSNAAITLLALNQLWELGLSMQQLSRIGLQLGADVPLFIKGRSAWASGVGELLEPIELPQQFYLVLWPRVAVSTAEIFSQEQLTRDSQAIKIADFLAGRYRNDCEPVVRRLYPVVDEALNWIAQFGHGRLTGTGSCVFVAFTREADAHQALASVPDKYIGYVAAGLNRLETAPKV